MNGSVKDIVKNAPNGVIVICGTIMAISILGAYVFLAFSGKDAAEVSRFVNVLFNFAMLVLGSVGAVAAGAAAKSANEAKTAAETTVTQTNGLADAEKNDIAGKAASAAIEQYIAKQAENPDQGTLL